MTREERRTWIDRPDSRRDRPSKMPAAACPRPSRIHSWPARNPVGADGPARHPRACPAFGPHRSAAFAARDGGAETATDLRLLVLVDLHLDRCLASGPDCLDASAPEVLASADRRIPAGDLAGDPTGELAAGPRQAGHAHRSDVVPCRRNQPRRLRRHDRRSGPPCGDRRRARGRRCADGRDRPGPASVPLPQAPDGLRRDRTPSARDVRSNRDDERPAVDWGVRPERPPPLAGGSAAHPLRASRLADGSARRPVR